MKVELIAYSMRVGGDIRTTPEDIIIEAASETSGLMPKPGIIGRLSDWGHESPFEHISFTFKITGISRACSHQFVRHRIASYSQASQRKRDPTELPPIIPPSANDYARWRIEGMWKFATELMHDLIERGMPLEDARYVIPHMAQTSIYVTMNCRSLRNFFKLRLSRSAQWEIRAVAKEMLQIVKRICPQVFADIEE